MIQRVTRADGTDSPLIPGPISLDGITPLIRKAPPSLGEDTRAVLSDLGLNEHQIAGLVAAVSVTVSVTMSDD